MLTCMIRLDTTRTGTQCMLACLPQAGVLSSHECAQLLGIAEAVGFTEDPDYVFSAQVSCNMLST